VTSTGAAATPTAAPKAAGTTSQVATATSSVSTSAGTAQSVRASSSATSTAAAVIGTGATRIEWWQGIAGPPTSPQQQADRATLDAFIKAHPEVSVTYNTSGTGDVDEQPVLTRYCRRYTARHCDRR